MTEEQKKNSGFNKYSEARENEDAQYKLAMHYKTGISTEQDIPKALELFKKLAEQGYSGAQNQLGNFYEKIEKNLEKAFYWTL
ncbi:unnamed protein product [Rhizophagus irregularis]|nr:unnamed protein product [Rhizophagus irregularis]